MAVTVTTEDRTTKVELAAGDVSAPVMLSGDAVVAVTPGVGGSMGVLATWSTPTDVSAGNARWHYWNAGQVSAKTTQTLLKATAVGVAEIRW